MVKNNSIFIELFNELLNMTLTFTGKVPQM